jgi:hypothetical protein
LRDVVFVVRLFVRGHRARRWRRQVDVLLSRVSSELRTGGWRRRFVFLVLFRLRSCGRRRRHAHARNWHATASTSVRLAGVVERRWLRSARWLASSTHRRCVAEAVADASNTSSGSIIVIFRLLLLRYLRLVLTSLLLTDSAATSPAGNLHSPLLSSVATLPASTLLALKRACGSTSRSWRLCLSCSTVSALACLLLSPLLRGCLSSRVGECAPCGTNWRGSGWLGVEASRSRGSSSSKGTCVGTKAVGDLGFG